nr:hypothetical protein BgiMline_001479 [Biomphalaria glabrata]
MLYASSWDTAYRSQGQRSRFPGAVRVPTMIDEGSVPEDTKLVSIQVACTAVPDLPEMSQAEKTIALLKSSYNMKKVFCPDSERRLEHLSCIGINSLVSGHRSTRGWSFISTCPGKCIMGFTLDQALT